MTSCAYVVGGTEGIGLAVAARLVARGDDVLVASRSQAKLDAALRQLEVARASTTQRVVALTVDLADASSIDDFVAEAVSVFGPPTLLVNTAGYARPGWLGEIPDEDVEGMVQLNLLGSIRLVKGVLPHLTRGSRVVLTSSMAGLAGVFGYTVYSATKFGIIGFAEALRRELRPQRIGVQVLCPPNTLTPGFDEETRHKPAEVLAAEEKASTMTAEAVADELMTALAGRRFLIVPGRSNRLSGLAIRHLPGVVDRVLRRPE